MDQLWWTPSTEACLEAVAPTFAAGGVSRRRREEPPAAGAERLRWIRRAVEPGIPASRRPVRPRAQIAAQARSDGLVGARGFEPPTTRSRTECATRLRYAPRGVGYTRFDRLCKVGSARTVGLLDLGRQVAAR